MANFTASAASTLLSDGTVTTAAPATVFASVSATVLTDTAIVGTACAVAVLRTVPARAAARTRLIFLNEFIFLLVSFI